MNRHPGGEGAPAAPLRTRLRQGVLDPSMLANPPVAALFCLLRAYHLVAPDPYSG